MVNEFVYCPRLSFLEWVQGEWDDNLDTIEGRWVHRRVDKEPATDVPAPPDDEASSADGGDAEALALTARSVLLSSDRLGAIARIDLLEAEGREATPVEYKRGAVPDIPNRAWDPERVQLCLQGLILRDNGYSCAAGVLYFAESKTRVKVAFDESLIEMTQDAVQGTRAMAEGGRLPPPLRDSPKCVRCSLSGICLPDETRAWSGEPPDEVRRLVPARPDALPVYVQAQGGTIGKRGDALHVTVPDEPPVSVRLLDASALSVFGNVQLTTQAMRAVCDEGIPVTFHSSTGWLVGVLNGGLGHKNVLLRVRQHAVAGATEASLEIARRMAEGKILNQRTLLRRNHAAPDRRLLATMAMHARQTRGARAVDQLMGIEGMAARLYFSALPQLLKGAGAWASQRFAEGGRNRRPPKDEVNAVLSFVYALLVRDCNLAAAVVGFDPYVGFLHAPHYGRPSLALDLAEEFRPLVGDSVTLNVFNQGEVVEKDFVRRARGVALSPTGRRAVISAYERRMNQTVTHPMFGYVVSYRRVVELQARLLRAVLMGEAEHYRAFTTR
ncbi:MAG: CRISPR-associated endonuclease Cas1 [Gemmatimonadaceae bacterium]|nr:CRISPR-associated endonuclease Cas1 [Gemmatimonadaceae bacterium]